MVISGPIAPFSNVPIQPQNYQPRRFVISNVTKGIQTLITTSTNHDYVVGQQIRVLIPFGYGITQLNEQDGYVLSIPAPNQILISINSSSYNSFLNISTSQQPQVVAIGNVNTGPINSNGRSPVGTFIPGSFINISPQP